MALAVTDLFNLFNRNRDFLNQVLQAVILNGFLKIDLDLVLITLVGMHHIPLGGFSLISHIATPDYLVISCTRAAAPLSITKMTMPIATMNASTTRV